MLIFSNVYAQINDIIYVQHCKQLRCVKWT